MASLFGPLALAVPLLAFVLRQLLRQQLCGELVRRPGSTKFADPGLYDELLLTEQARREYLRDGFTVLRGALRPEAAEALKEAVLRSAHPFMRSIGGFASNLWMRSDEYLDFLVHGSLGAWAAQLFASAGTESAGLPPSAHVWRDFLVERNSVQGRFLAWHVDRDECEGDLPANFTLRSRLRFVVPLGDGLRGTVFLNQSLYAAAMAPQERARYWRGELPRRACGTHCGEFSWDAVPRLPGVELPEAAAVHTGRLALGDVLAFSACAWHRSPGYDEEGLHFVLQPAYAHGASRVFGRVPLGCRHGLAEGAAIANSPDCFPQAWPREKRPREGELRLSTAFKDC